MNASKITTPVVFIGHGSPMNAIAKNDFTQSLKELGLSLRPPKAILVISAHWLTNGTFYQASVQPKTIHDFGGFPEALYNIQYLSPGSPGLAHMLEQAELGKATNDWGLDHGSWSVLLHLYPKANIPVFQMSLNRNLSFKEHFELAQKLRFLREDDVLIVASGNMVHNLYQIEWEEKSTPYAWAIEFDELVKKNLEQRNFEGLINMPAEKGRLFNLAHPSYEHYLPLLYAVGASTPNDQMHTIFDGIQNASISMRSVIFS